MLVFAGLATFRKRHPLLRAVSPLKSPRHRHEIVSVRGRTHVRRAATNARRHFIETATPLVIRPIPVFLSLIRIKSLPVTSIR